MANWFKKAQQWTHNNIGGKTEAQHQAEARDKNSYLAAIEAPPPTEADAIGRAGPLLSAMQARYTAGIPAIKRNAFAGFAGRGFGNSELTEKGMTNALTTYTTSNKNDRQSAINTALSQLMGEHQAAATTAQGQLETQQRQLYG